MAERVRKRKQKRFSFKTVQLLKDQSLGIGSYGAVCKAICDDLVCAAKIIHPTLFDPSALHQIAPQREHRLPIQRFEQECEFMSNMRHPNIVQYLGTYRTSADTCLPVLLMELMDDSLTHFLESSPQPIPYHIAINICHDVTLALSFLHSNNIVHRDLSSNNVLLRGNVLAKVTDFGMARLGDINPHATPITSTTCPGTDVYMPPEAVQDKPVYTEKIDCFSFGVIILQILTRLFPKPGERYMIVNDPRYPRPLKMDVLEQDRRQNHISKVDTDHPLLPVILDCLKDKDNKRPSAHQLCERVADLKRMEKYIDSARTVQDKDKVIQSLASRVEENVRAISSKEEENQQLRQQLRKKDEELGQALEERGEIIKDKVQTLMEKGKQLAEKDEQLEKMRQVCDHVRHEKDQASKQLVEKDIQLQQERDEARRRLEERERQLGRKRDEARRQSEERERQLGQVNQQLQEAEQVVAQFQRRDAELPTELETRRKLVERERNLGQERDETRRQSEEREGQLGQKRIEARRRLEERERRLRRVNKQLQEAEQVVAQFQRRVAELEQLLSQRDQQNPEANSRGKELASVKLKWREGKRAPRGMYRLYDSVVDGNTVCIRSGSSPKLYSYNATTDSWSQLPDCVKGGGSITVINGQLTTVGGVKSNELFSLTGEGSSRRWTKEYPPMPTKRQCTTSLCTGAALIVAGGVGEGEVLSTVEVMNTENHQWSTAADLPQPIHSASATVCGDRIYMLGGVDERFTGTKSVYTCSVSALLQSSVPSSLEAELKRTFLSDKASIWRQVADLPVTYSTCESFNGRLLAIGGKDDSKKATTAVYEYSSTSNSWEVISHMTTARYSCFSAVLPNNQLMVVGGETAPHAPTDTVELARVIT